MPTLVPGSRVTPIDPTVVLARKPHIKLRANGTFEVQGVGGPSDFFGPMQPLVPVAQEQAYGRQFDYPVGYNTRITPRLEEGVSFAQLYALADGYDVLRLIIERVKDEISAQGWTVGPKDRKAKRDSRSDEIEAFFASPDKRHTWLEWSRMLLDQALVLDAPALYCRPDRKGDLFALEIVDGATIKRVLTEDGRTPLPDEGPAYQQILKGLPAVDYVTPLPKGQTSEMPELLYKPRNVRPHKIYGYSPVEQVITTVNIALHRQLYQLSYYTDGSTPDLIFQVPATWNPDQIKAFQQWWDSLLRGNLENRRGARFVPNGVAPYDTKDKALKDEYDEWLIRIVCFALGVSPTPFIKQMNRATAQTHQEQQIQEGLEPWLNWLADLVDTVIRVKFGADDLVFRWEEDEAIDPLEQAQIYATYCNAKVYHPDEVRQKLGDDAMSEDMRAQMDQPTFAQSVNATVLPPEQQAEADARAAERVAQQPRNEPASEVAGKLAKKARSASRMRSRSSHSIPSALRY